MELISYLLFRVFARLMGFLPIEAAFRLGEFLGTIIYYICIPYRRLATDNLTIAFGREKSVAEIRRLARRHFQTLVANLLVISKLNQLPKEKILERLEVEGLEEVLSVMRSGRGVLSVGSHMGPWELIPQSSFVFDGFRNSAIYQRMGNERIERFVTQVRSRFGLQMLERKEGVAEAIKILRGGGITGILIDQHAGDGGTWTPFFHRLASTSPIAALIAARSGAALFSMAVETTGIARWKIVYERSVTDEKRPLELTTALLNQVLEKQIRRSPHEWFWVHDRWKTPNPEFLIANEKRYRRGICLPPGIEFADLQPFQLLVRSSNWLGDAVMTVPAVQAMIGGRPDLQITILCKEKLADVWKLLPGIHDVLIIKPGQGIFAVAKMLTKKKFDAAVIFPNSMRTALEPWLAGIPRRVGYDRQGRSFFLNQIIRDLKRVGPPQHQSLHYLRFAESVGADMSRAMFPKIQRNKPYAPVRLGLVAGAEYGSAKRWLPERFIAVGQAVAKRRHCEWLVFGTAAEFGLADDIASQIGPAAKNLAGKTTLAQLIERLGECTALLTNDTGTMHLAALLGVPTISIFGSTEPILTGPMGENHRVIRHQVECSPCFLRECPIDFRCMKAVQVDEVVEAVMKSLGG